MKIQFSANFTANLKIELLNIIQLDFEMEFVPLLVGADMSWYIESDFEALCFQMTPQLIPLNLETRVTKNIA